MSPALTSTPWLAVLARIVKKSDDETTRTLAKMLYDVVDVSSDPDIAQILDTYGYHLLRSIS